MILSPITTFEADLHFSWSREVFVPAFFTVLGVVLGFAVNRISDDWKADRAKRSFLRAVRMELDALGDQLDGFLDDVKASIERVEKDGTGPHLVVALRTSVFEGQIEKLRDVDDSLLIELIHFYSDLGMVQNVIKGANHFSAEYNQTTSDVQKPIARNRLLSPLKALQETVSTFRNRLRILRPKLP